MSVKQTSIIFRTLQCGLRFLHGQKPRHLYSALTEESDNQRRIILLKEKVGYYEDSLILPGSLRCQNQHTTDSNFYPISEMVSKKEVSQGDKKL